MNIKCGKCYKKKHGAIVSDMFACFSCMINTSWAGDTHAIHRVPNDYWHVEVGLRQPDGTHITQWVPVGDDYETAYVLYIAKLVVT